MMALTYPSGMTWYGDAAPMLLQVPGQRHRSHDGSMNGSDRHAGRREQDAQFVDLGWADLNFAANQLGAQHLQGLGPLARRGQHHERRRLPADPAAR